MPEGLFRTKSEKFPAIQVERFNTAEVITWLFRQKFPGHIAVGPSMTENGMVHRPLTIYQGISGHPTKLEPGYWLMKVGDAEFITVASGNFESLYEEVERNPW